MEILEEEMRKSEILSRERMKLREKANMEDQPVGRNASDDHIDKRNKFSRQIINDKDLVNENKDHSYRSSWANEVERELATMAENFKWLDEKKRKEKTVRREEMKELVTGMNVSGRSEEQADGR